MTLKRNCLECEGTGINRRASATGYCVVCHGSGIVEELPQLTLDDLLWCCGGSHATQFVEAEQ